MRSLELLVCVLSGMSAMAYICRLDSLQYKRHTLATIVLHISLFSCACASAFAAWDHNLSLQTLAGAAASAAWIWISLPSWRFGPPSHVTKAEPLAAKHWPRVAGGTKK